MRALIDTNILIHRETKTPVVQDIGTLFYWLGKLKYTVCIHPITKQEILSNKNKEAVKAFTIKMLSYELLKEPASLHPKVQEVSDSIDTNENDLNDSKILNEVFCGRVDIFLTEDKKIHRKARQLGIETKIYTVSSFLNYVKDKVPGLVNYDILEIRKKDFLEIDVNDPFFDSFREDYPFNEWFNRKSAEQAYVLLNELAKVEAFLYLKVEDESENYWNISPQFKPKKRLKIGTFKVSQVGKRLGERFLKIIFDNAKKNKVDEIYVTLFKRNDGHKRLIEMLEAWGFFLWGEKNSQELVYVRKFTAIENTPVNRVSPKKTYPYISQKGQFYIIPIKREFHTDLFPDSIIKGEKKEDFIDATPHRNAISKCYLSNSPVKNLHSGDGIVFYRTGESRVGYQNIVTTIGLVEGTINDIDNEEELIKLTRNRTVFDEQELRNFFKKSQDWSSQYKLFVINFLYIGTLKKRYNLKQLIELGVVDRAPRGIGKISKEQFGLLIKNNL